MSDGAAGEVQPWLLLGERRRRTLEHRVQTAAERWVAHWVAGTVTLSVVFERAAQDRRLEYGERKSISFGARGKSGEWHGVLGVPRRLVAWAAGLAAVEFSAIADPDEVSVSGEIELEMVREFWDLLVPKAVAAPLERLDEAIAEEAQLTLAKQGLRVACTFGPAPGLCIQSTLSPAAVATLLAERQINYVGESLTPRRFALAQTPVALDCCLGSVQVPVRDLHSLRIGDVLVTDIALDGRAELRVRSKPRSIAAGTIGAVEGRKAIKVETAQVVTANQGLRR